MYFIELLSCSCLLLQAGKGCVVWQPALSRTQYAAAGAATLGVFLAFYAAFGLLVLAQRWPAFARHVLPRAKLKDPADASEAAIPIYCTNKIGIRLVLPR